MEAKFLLKSKTIWGILLMVIPAVCPLLGIEPPSSADLQQFGDNLFTTANGIIQIIGALLAVYGRLTAKHQLKVTK